MNSFSLFFAALFSIINPFGTIPIFVALTTNFSTRDITKVAVKTSLYVLLVLVLSYIVGNYVLEFFGISLNSLKLAGGLVIATSGYALLTGSFTEHKGIGADVKSDISTRQEIALTPLAIPMLAGPGAISLLITYNQEYDKLLDKVIMYISITAVAVSVFFILRGAHYISKFMGASGINALSRVIGLFVIAIGVEYITGAIKVIFKL